MVCKECKAPAVLFTCKKCEMDTCNKCNVDQIEEKLGVKQRLKNGSDCILCGAEKSMALVTALTKTSKKSNDSLKTVLTGSKLGKGVYFKCQLSMSMPTRFHFYSTGRSVEGPIEGCVGGEGGIGGHQEDCTADCTEADRARSYGQWKQVQINQMFGIKMSYI
ncbi:uncharacterized protein LOC134842877 [Symsagittifera roscoffensis]|uniref:uncharacterized protein LOC134842877 n=1 Tax=Symsagittifera roscoffensis TaxID=84072 RepID=UPI00307CA3D6